MHACISHSQPGNFTCWGSEGVIMSMTSFVVIIYMACKKCKLYISGSCSRHCLYLYNFHDPEIVVIRTFGFVHLSCSRHHLYSYIFYVPDIVHTYTCMNHTCTSGTWEIHIHAHTMSIFLLCISIQYYNLCVCFFHVPDTVFQYLYMDVFIMLQTLYCYIFHVAGVD